MKSSADQSEPEKGGPREMGAGRIVGEGIPMYVIVNLLSNMLGRAVINNTGLTGKFDVVLEPALEQMPQAGADRDDLNFAIVEAVEKQLGLRMESARAAQEVLVIDRIERPLGN